MEVSISLQKLLRATLQVSWEIRQEFTDRLVAWDDGLEATEAIAEIMMFSLEAKSTL